MSELIFRSDGAYIEDFSGELVPVKVHYTRLDAPPSIDTDHAVALEREAIAAWHERRARAAQEHAQGLPPQSNRHQLLAEDFAVHKAAAQAIRNGQHHAPAEEQK